LQLRGNVGSKQKFAPREQTFASREQSFAKALDKRSTMELDGEGLYGFDGEPNNPRTSPFSNRTGGGNGDIEAHSPSMALNADRVGTLAITNNVNYNTQLGNLQSHQTTLSRLPNSNSFMNDLLS